MSSIPIAPIGLKVLGYAAGSQVSLGWNRTTDAQIESDFLYSAGTTTVNSSMYSNDPQHVSAQVNQQPGYGSAPGYPVWKSAVLALNPDYISLHHRTMVGYRIHRGNSSDFVPVGEAAGQGNLIVDETSLDPATTQFADTNPGSGQTVYYKIAQMVQP